MQALLLSNLLLWVIVVVLALFVLALTRQLGIIHERINPTGALMMRNGLEVGQPAPVVDVTDIQGRFRRIGERRTDGRSLLLLFLSPSCPVCKALLPVLKSTRRSESRSLEIVLASDDAAHGHQEFIRAQQLEEFPFVLSAPLGITYQVDRLPYAVLLDAAGVLRARGLINSREHLESLFEAQRLGAPSIQDYLQRHAHAPASSEIREVTP